MSKRNCLIDVLKGVAIIAVVLYHLRVLPYGYLGVDIFLVVNGYFITKGLMKTFNNGTFSYSNFLLGRIARLWPLVVFAGLISLPIGYFFMLPDDLENLAQTVVASNFFGENILSFITTGDYWKTVNDYKPLMHFWYVGLLMQCYVVYPIFFALSRKFSNDFDKTMKVVISVIALFSLALYVMPTISFYAKFYNIPFRMFELVAGGLVAVYMERIKEARIPNLALVFIIGTSLCCVWAPFESGIVKVLIITALTGLGVLFCEKYPLQSSNLPLRFLSSIGIASYSIFVWHQVVFALYRYILNSQPGWKEQLLLLVIVTIVSWLSFKFIEQPLSNVKSNRGIWKLVGITALIAFLTTSASMYLYVKAGVVRNVPELDIYVNDVHRGMHAEYCDRVYSMDRPFECNDKKKVLAIGDSFARDMVNILLESDYKDSLEISYLYTLGYIKDRKAFVERVNEADVIFCRGMCIKNMPEDIQELLLAHPNIYGIGTKGIGETNGNVYSRRFSKSYYSSRLYIPAKVKLVYDEEKSFWKDKYVDLIEPLISDDMTMPVFSDENKYISQDCSHLTRAGAIYYSKILPLKDYFK